MKLHQQIVLSVLAITLTGIVGFGVFLIELNFDARLGSEVATILSDENSIRTIIKYQLEDNGVLFSRINQSYLKHDYSAEIYSQWKKLLKPDIVRFKGQLRPEINVTSESGRKYILRKYKGSYYISVSGWMSILDNKLIIVSTKKINYIFQTRVGEYLRFILLTFGFLVLMIIVLALAVRMNLTSLSVLLSAVKKIRSGNIEQHIPLRGPSDIKQISRQFNFMTEEISSRIDEVTELNKRQEHFIAGFTHELHTPLTNIIGYGDILATREVEPEELQKFAELIVKEGGRLRNLGIELRKLILLNEEIAFKPVSSVVLISRIKEMTEGILAAGKIKLDVKIEKCVLLINKDLVLSALYNILENSVEASAEGDTVTLEVIKNTGGIIISIHDHGKGIPEKEIGTITSPFIKNEKLDKDKKNLGLGLFLVSKIIDVHDAQLTVESESSVGTKINLVFKYVKKLNR